MVPAETSEAGTTLDRAPRWARNGLLGVVAALTLVRIYQVARSGFDGLHGQDPFAYFGYASGPLLESILALQGPPPFHWPPGFPYLVALVVLITGATPLAGVAVSLVAGGIVPIVTWLLTRELWPRDRGGREIGALIAGILTAVNGALWRSSVLVASDATGLAFATIGVWALSRYARRHAPGKWLVLAAGAMALAVLTRWAYALVAAPITLAALVLLAPRPRRIALAHAVGATLVVILLLTPVWPQVGSLVFGSADPDPSFVVDLEVFRWSPANALRNTLTTLADGETSHRLPNGLYYLAAPAHWRFLTPLLIGFVVPGLLVTIRQRDPMRALLLLGWLATVLGFHMGTPYQAFRFLLAVAPPLAIATAIGVSEMWTRFPARWPRRLLIGAVGVGLLTITGSGWHYTEALIQSKQNDLRTMDWAEGIAPSNARLLAFELTLTLQQYSRLETREFYYEDPASLSLLLAEPRPLLLLLDVEDVEQQWRHDTPGRNLRWLRSHTALEPLGHRPPYTLFAINPYEAAISNQNPEVSGR